MPSKKHDDIAKYLAKKFGTTYNKRKGPDINLSDKVIEVEPSTETIPDAIRQLQGFKKPRYIALPTEEIVAAKERLRNTKIGIMDEKGNIHKRAQKPQKS